MKGQAVARILFVITLIVTAHAIRPFSMKNLTSHILYSTRSLSVVLPDSTRSSFDYANTLAIALSQNMFVDRSSTETPATPPTDLLAAAKTAPISQPQEVVVVKPSAKAIRVISETPRRIKPIAKPVGTEIPLNNDVAEVSDPENSDEAEMEEATVADSTPADEVAEVESTPAPADRAFTVGLPIALPVSQFNLGCALSKIRPVQVELPRIEIVRTDFKVISLHGQIKMPKMPDCNQRKANHIRLIAVIEPPRRRKAENPANPILECEDEGTEVEVTEAETTGPQAEEAENGELQMKLAPLVPNSSESCAIQP